jgi:ferredoxin
VNVKIYESPDSPDCIRCLKCEKVCPFGSIGHEFLSRKPVHAEFSEPET